MKTNMLRYPWAALALIFILFSCTADELDRSRIAETHYVDLLYALHHEDIPAAKKAASVLSNDLSGLRVRWYRPMEDEAADNMYFRLARAQGAFTDTREAIAEGNLELAAIQLDRAVYELSVADPIAFNQLYVGSIYDFVATWLEVSHTINDQELCQLTWQGFSRYGKDARYAWRQARWERPSDQIYWQTVESKEAFLLAHTAVDLAIDHFIKVVEQQDQCTAQEAARQVDDKLWKLLRQFSSQPVSNL